MKLKTLQRKLRTNKEFQDRFKEYLLYECHIINFNELRDWVNLNMYLLSFNKKYYN